MAPNTAPGGACSGHKRAKGAVRPARPRVRTTGPSPNARHDEGHPKQVRVATLNVGTLKGKEGEVVETLTRRRVDLCCLQETRLHGDLNGNQARLVKGKDTNYKLYWCGNLTGQGGVAVLLHQRWIEKVFAVQRISDRILLLKLIVGKAVYSFISLYAPQKDLSAHEKERFYDQLQSTCMAVPDSEQLFCLGDWNGHVGEVAGEFSEVHGGHGFGLRNAEGRRVLEFAVANNLIIGNTRFIKRDSHLITFESGGNKSQVDYVLFPRKLNSFVTNVKVIPGEECAKQHRLLVCDFRVHIPRQKQRKFVPRLRTWKLRDPTKSSEFSEAFRRKIEQVDEHNEPPSVESAWSVLKNTLLETASEVCGFTRNHQWKKETWWWNDRVDTAITEKRKHFKTYNTLNSRGNTPDAIKAKAKYNAAKYVAKQAVREAKSEAEAETFRDIDPYGPGIYRLAKQMDRTNQDVVGEKCIRNDAGELALTDADKKKAWVEHCSKLLNVEFDWPRDLLPEVPPTEGASPPVTTEQITAAIGKMKCGKAAGPSGVTAEMLKAAGTEGIELIRQLAERVFAGEPIPKEWEESIILNLYKGKGDALDRGNYRGLKLTDQVLKVLERVLDSAIRDMVDINEMQFGFVPGKGTTDAIFMARQMQEKHHAVKKPVYFAFVDLEKAFDRVPRDVLWWALRTLGVEEWAIRAIQSMYANARSRVRVNDQYSEEFGVKVGVHQGSVLSPLLFILVLEALSREFRTGTPWNLLYADDLLIIADTLDECKKQFKRWREEMEKKGLRVNIKKTKFMCSGRGQGIQKDSGKYPCAVCRKGTGRNAIICSQCEFWVHGKKKCSGIAGRLKEDPTYVCLRCRGDPDVEPIDGRPVTSTTVDDCTLEVVNEFCYLGDMLDAGGGCTRAITARCCAAWGKFKKLRPILTSKHLSPIVRGNVYNACVRSAMLHGGETWAPLAEDIQILRRNDRAMIRWMCGVKIRDEVPSDSLLAKLGLEEITSALRSRRLRWHGHVTRATGCIHTVMDPLADSKGRGRPPKSWRECVRTDIMESGLSNTDPMDRTAWRAGIRAARLLPTPISGNAAAV